MELETIGIATFLAPVVMLVVSLLKSAHLPSIVNLLIAVLVSFVAGAISLVAGGTVDSFEDIDTLTEIVSITGVVFTVATAIYHGFFKNSGVNMTLTKMLWGTPDVPPSGL